MSRPNALVIGSVALVLLAGGCQRHHKVTFVNNTARDVTATLSGPGEIMPSRRPCR